MNDILRYEIDSVNDAQKRLKVYAQKLAGKKRK